MDCSPGGASILFAKGTNRAFRLCSNFWGLSKFAQKDHRPLPLALNPVDQLGSAEVHTKPDLCARYHIIRTPSGHAWDMSCWTCHGSLKFLAMLWGLTKAPATFQHFMDNIFQAMSTNSWMIYLDNILACPESENKPLNDVRCALMHLRENHLCFVLDVAKANAISRWPTPTQCPTIHLGGHQVFAETRAPSDVQHT